MMVLPTGSALFALLCLGRAQQLEENDRAPVFRGRRDRRGPQSRALRCHTLSSKRFFGKLAQSKLEPSGSLSRSVKYSEFIPGLALWEERKGRKQPFFGFDVNSSRYL